jgi:hypothetical protein
MNVNEKQMREFATMLDGIASMTGGPKLKISAVAVRTGNQNRYVYSLVSALNGRPVTEHWLDARQMRAVLYSVLAVEQERHRQTFA